MPPLKFTEVLAYSSEDPNHPVENLLKPDTYLKWKSKSGQNEKQEYAVLKLEKLSAIRSIDIGNEHTAFVEILVAREGTDYQVLLVASSFMSPLESRNSTITNRVRMFGPDKLNKSIAEQKWDRIKIICTQPFNRNVQHGLTFVKIYGPESKEISSTETKLGQFTLKEEDEENESLAIGSFFARRQEKETPLTGAAAIRAASKASLTSENTQPTKRPAEESANAPELGFYQLKKKAKESPIPETKEQPQPSSRHTKNEDITNKPKQSPVISHPKNNTPSKNHVKSTESVAANKTRKSRPFNQLMKDVIFAMSGYQNPQRAQLRDNLVAMGAKYKSDWEHGCTHLVCAFKHTPKYQAVKGKGKIVSEKWVEDCYKKKIRMPWRRYNLEKNRNNDESEEEIWATEICPKEKNEETKGNSEKATSELCDTEPIDDSEDTDDEIQRVLQDNKNKAKEERTTEIKNENHEKREEATPKKDIKPINGTASDGEYGADTDVDEDLVVIEKKETSGLSLPPLKNFLKGKTFFLYGSLEEAKRKALTRYIIAFQGEVSNYMSEKVHFVLTDDAWDENFDEALNENPSLQFVKPHWIWKCCNKEKFVPPQPYLIVPKDEES